MSSSHVASQVQGSAVTVADVRLLEVDPGTVLDFRLASPDSDTAFEELVLEVKGSIVTRASRTEAIEVVWGREVVRELAVEVSGGAERRSRGAAGVVRGRFHGVVGALRLPPSFQLALVARLEDGRRIWVAEIVGRRGSVEPGPGWAGPRGAFVSSPSGRTGTTWIVQLLGQHPQVIAHPPFGVEPRPSSYWIEAAMALTEPGSYKRMMRPNMDHDRWWLGEWPDADRDPIDDPLLRRYLGEPPLEGDRGVGPRTDHRLLPGGRRGAGEGGRRRVRREGADGPPAARAPRRPPAGDEGDRAVSRSPRHALLDPRLLGPQPPRRAGQQGDGNPRRLPRTSWPPHFAACSPNVASARSRRSSSATRT